MRKIALFISALLCLASASAQESVRGTFIVLNMDTDESYERVCSVTATDTSAVLDLFDTPVPVKVTSTERVCGRTHTEEDGFVYHDRICGTVYNFDEDSYMFIGTINRKRICMICVSDGYKYVFINTEYLEENGYLPK